MRYLTLAGLMLFAGCSHAYVQRFGDGQVTTCCPQKKLGCKQAALDKLAIKQCHGSATPVSMTTKDSGVQAVYNSNFADISITRDACISYKCQ